MIKVLAILLIIGSLTSAADPSDDKSNEVEPKPPVNLDPVLRKALLKAITDLENERVTTPSESPVTDLSDVTTEVNEILETGDEERKNDGQEITKSVVNYHSFVVNEPSVIQPESEVIPSDVKENNSPVIVDDIVESRSEDIETKETSNVFVQSRNNQKEIYTDEFKSVTKKPVTNIQKSVTQQQKQNLPVTSTTPKSIYNEDGENIEQLEDVQVFQAPLVAAFTVHQDINGLPKKVIPIYKQALRAPIEPLPSPFRSQQQINQNQQVQQDVQNRQNQQVQQDLQSRQNQQDLQSRQNQQAQNQQVSQIQSQQVQQIQNLNSQQTAQLRQSQDQKQVESIQQQLNIQQQLEQKQRLLEQQLRDLQQQQRQHEDLLRQQQLLQQQSQQQNILSFEEQQRIKQQQYLQQQAQIQQQNVIGIQDPLRQQSGLTTTSVTFQPSISLPASQNVPGTVELQPPQKEPSDFLNSFRVQSPVQLSLSNSIPNAPSPHQQPPFERPLSANNFNGFSQQSSLINQQLPIEKSFVSRFNPASQGFQFQQQLPNDKPFLNFNTIPLQGPSSTRVFRHDSSTGNFGFNPNNIFNPVGFLSQNNNNFRPQQSRFRIDDHLKNLLIQSGLSGNNKNQEELSIVSKVLSLNHGIAPGSKVINENLQFIFGNGKRNDAPVRPRIN